jgi:predicted branched-subunit amino acid permease
MIICAFFAGDERANVRALGKRPSKAPSIMSAPPFTRHGLRAGAIGAVPLIPTVAVYAVAFGVMAQASGLTAPEASLLSGWVFAGGAQMASLQAWDTPVPILAVCLTTLAMNARYVLLSAALRPWFNGLPPHQSYASLFFLGDGNWAIAMREREAGRCDAAYLMGSGAILWFVWVPMTAAGHMFGEALGDPARFGVDFILAAFFATLAVTFFHGVRSILPLAVGAVAAIIAEHVIGGSWYIFAGAVAGSVAGALRADAS